MGGGLLAAGVLGALGAAALARGYNLIRGVGKPSLAWSEPVLAELARGALLRYLAVAHYGRGRGKWSESEHPAFWSDAVDAVIAQRPPGAMLADGNIEALTRWLDDASADLLHALYPSWQRDGSTRASPATR